jgi:hypothetical protein
MGVPINEPIELIPHIIPILVPSIFISGHRAGCEIMDVGPVTITPVKKPQ